MSRSSRPWLILARDEVHGAPPSPRRQGAHTYRRQTTATTARTTTLVMTGHRAHGTHSATAQSHADTLPTPGRKRLHCRPRRSLPPGTGRVLNLRGITARRPPVATATFIIIGGIGNSTTRFLQGGAGEVAAMIRAVGPLSRATRRPISTGARAGGTRVSAGA